MAGVAVDGVYGSSDKEESGGAPHFGVLCRPFVSGKEPVVCW